MKHFNYALIDPITKEVRYIGETNNPKVRLRDHINKTNEGNYKSNWIKSLKHRKLKPEMVILAEFDNRQDCLDNEIALIKQFREQRAPLTNLTDGGEGMGGNIPSLAARQRMSEKAKGRKHSQETKDKLSKYFTENPSRAMLGKKWTDKQRQNSTFPKGYIPWNKGLKTPQEERQKILDDNSRDRISDDELRKMLTFYVSGKYSQVDLCTMFSITSQHMTRIVKGEVRQDIVSEFHINKELIEKIKANVMAAKRIGKKVSEESKRKMSSSKLNMSEATKILAVNNNPKRKLNANDVVRIKELYATGKYTQKQIGIMFDVSASHISCILANKTGKFLR